MKTIIIVLLLLASCAVESESESCALDLTVTYTVSSAHWNTRDVTLPELVAECAPTVHTCGGDMLEFTCADQSIIILTVLSADGSGYTVDFAMGGAHEILHMVER